MSSLLETLDAISPNAVAALCLTKGNGVASASKTQRSQISHRIQIIQAWLVTSAAADYKLEANIVGKKTLDIGCGQGDMTALFASVLKAFDDQKSRVIGVDPARLDYGR